MDKDISADFTDNEREQVERLSASFRAAIGQCNPADLPVTLKQFPHGACGDAALLLAEYLHEQGYGRAHYVLGRRGDWSHAWLELRGSIIDITADQFEDYTETRFVLQDMAWHSQFLPTESEPADFHRYDARTVNTLAGAYLTIKKRLE